jgi:peptidoglycan biosynthesis protein MviN/MurJ (putative lipid II flippase)
MAIGSALMEKTTSSRGLGTLGSGAVTAVALAIQTGLAAIVGVVAGHEFGRSATTDGFNATYGVFIVASFAAGAIRVAVMPALARARQEHRLGSEAAAYGLTMTCLSLPLLLLALAAASPVAWLLTGAGSAAARHTAAAALPWMIAAAVLQLFAGLAASSLAALDNYATAAAGYALGSVTGLAYILLRMHPDGLIALPRGLALNGATALFVPLLVLVLRARAERMPAAAVRPSQYSFRSRTTEIANCVSLPLVMQFIYLICLALAARQGVGAQTSFSYAYLIAAAVVAVSGSSLSLVTSVPLARIGLDSSRVARHVIALTWLAVMAIGACAGVFGLAGGRIVHALLGAAYGARVGSQLGLLVVVLSFWAITSVAFSVTFPLMFIAGKSRRLSLLAIAALIGHVPVALVAALLGGLEGLAIALALTTSLVVALMLFELRALRSAVRGFGIATLTIGATAAAAFVLPRLVLGPLSAAAVGCALYVGVLIVARPKGLIEAWRYLHQLA